MHFPEPQRFLIGRKSAVNRKPGEVTKTGNPEKRNKGKCFQHFLVQKMKCIRVLENDQTNGRDADFVAVVVPRDYNLCSSSLSVFVVKAPKVSVNVGQKKQTKKKMVAAVNRKED